MKPYFEKITFGECRQFVIGLKVSGPYAIWFCVWKWVFYIGVKK